MSWSSSSPGCPLWAWAAWTWWRACWGTRHSSPGPLGSRERSCPLPWWRQRTIYWPWCNFQTRSQPEVSGSSGGSALSREGGSSSDWQYRYLWLTFLISQLDYPSYKLILELYRNDVFIILNTNNVLLREERVERGPLIVITYIPFRCSVAGHDKICREGGEDHNDKFSQEQQEIADSFSKITSIKQMTGWKNFITCPTQPLELSFSQVTCRQHWQRNKSLYSIQKISVWRRDRKQGMLFLISFIFTFIAHIM